ncbi:axonemal dynein light intermediate polypeptide 1-like isoform X2 [Hippocampus comes]|uniref:axonemal dynein light intermediate polypeptide 1-like isoform X2 n=1 Tax=Hippocampus comes TaxID=109280 RepID=UPI00094ECE26|nr:PREDICTED: axonemal dynein light intermediate polypeptide 1-like isoform X2 [Hippocampus comes]
MNAPAESLLRYDRPVLVPKSADKKSAKGRPTKVLKSKPQQPSDSLLRPRKSITATLEDIKQKNEDILNLMFPPRKWEEANKEWIQRVCSEPSTRVDVVNLEEELDKKLLHTRAMETGICPLRRQLYTECFDELIRQVVLICVERGLLLLRISDLENLVEELMEQLQQQKKKCVDVKKMATEKQQAQEKKHTEEIQTLRKNNQQLKVQLEGVFTAKK